MSKNRARIDTESPAFYSFDYSIPGDEPVITGVAETYETERDFFGAAKALHSSRFFYARIDGRWVQRLRYMYFQGEPSDVRVSQLDAAASAYHRLNTPAGETE